MSDTGYLGVHYIKEAIAFISVYLLQYIHCNPCIAKQRHIPYSYCHGDNFFAFAKATVVSGLSNRNARGPTSSILLDKSQQHRFSQLAGSNRKR